VANLFDLGLIVRFAQPGGPVVDRAGDGTVGMEKRVGLAEGWARPMPRARESLRRGTAIRGEEPVFSMTFKSGRSFTPTPTLGWADAALDSIAPRIDQKE
jgi:hypothetical protein